MKIEFVVFQYSQTVKRISERVSKSFHNDDKDKMFIMELTFFRRVIFIVCFRVRSKRSYKIQIQTK